MGTLPFLDLGTRWRWVVTLMPLGKEPPVPILWEAGWAPETVWALWRREESLNRIPAVQSVARPCTNWSNSAHTKSYTRPCTWRAIANTIKKVFGFHLRCIYSWVAKRLLASQDLCSTELVNRNDLISLRHIQRNANELKKGLSFICYSLSCGNTICDNNIKHCKRLLGDLVRSRWDFPINWPRH
jgi:hypothetical protein